MVKYSVNGEGFTYVDDFRLYGPPAISWNLFRANGKDGEKVVVPQPLGLKVKEHKGVFLNIVISKITMEK